MTDQDETRKANSKTGLWNAVSKSDPQYLKKVNQRGGFTAICAYSQIQAATACFGPVGEGWGWDIEWKGDDGDGEFVIARVALWWKRDGSDERRTVNAVGCCTWGGNRVDTDAPKKALTDGITKALSYLGFNADVFLGKMDGNKYIGQPPQQQQRREPPRQQAPAQEPPPREDGKPVWWGREIKMKGPCQGKTWGEVSEGEPGSARHRFCKFILTIDPLDADKRWHAANLEQQEAARACLEMIEARAVEQPRPAEEHEREYAEPTDGDWGPHDSAPGPVIQEHDDTPF
jgi:hypothetical protein